MPKFEVIVFDLDGTLIDSAPDIQAAMNAVLSKMGRATLDLPTITSFVGHGVENLTAKCLSATGDCTDALAREICENFLTVLSKNPVSLTKPYPGVLEFLDKMSAQKIPMGLCTNKENTATARTCDALDLSKYFKVIQGSVPDFAKKPDPAMLLEVIDALGGTIETTLYVGDSEIDQATAINSGVAFAFFSGGYLNARLQKPDPLITFDAWPLIFDQMQKN